MQQLLNIDSPVTTTPFTSQYGGRDKMIEQEMELTKNDYLKIIKYYGVRLPKKASLSTIREIAENIMGNKLCSCIKRIGAVSPRKNNTSESAGIAICTKSLFNNRGLVRYSFTCRKKGSDVKKARGVLRSKKNDPRKRGMRKTLKVIRLPELK